MLVSYIEVKVVALYGNGVRGVVRSWANDCRCTGYVNGCLLGVHGHDGDCDCSFMSWSGW